MEAKRARHLKFDEGGDAARSSAASTPSPTPSR
jgi:hypothetical protein